MSPRAALTGLALALAVGACAAPASRTARPEVTPAAPRISTEALVAAHRAKAEGLERDGNLLRARDEWAIALTINPNDRTSRVRRDAVESRIERATADRVRQGRDALARGAHLEARRHFLAALALDPRNAIAFEALQNQVKDVRFVTYTVRRGDSLPALAERYYGDRSRAEVIAETNQLAPNARLVPGRALRIPEIPGVPFVPGEARPPAPPAEPVEVDPLLLEAREALGKGEYAVALADVDRLLAGNPQNPEGLDLKKAILYGLGKAQLQQQRYADSYQTLTQLARLAPTYQDTAALLRQARDRLILQHYNQGLRLYREEKLEEAIAEWRLALELDPQHVNARRNLEQAERVLRGLEQRRRSTAPGK